MHWAVAVPFMVCYMTAVVLITVYNPDPVRPFRAVVSWTHRLSGVCLFVLPLWIVLRHWYDVAIHKENIREVWRWTLADLKWLFVMGPAMLSKKIILPEQGKFNAAEKINFMVLTATVPMYICTGAMIWSHQFVFSAWIVHFTMAAAATPLMFGHMFMAMIFPDTRVGLSGMITGFVDRHWASHHYGRWYRQNFAQAGHQLAADAEAASMAEAAVSTSAPSAVSAHPAAWEPFLGDVSLGTPLIESPHGDPAPYIDVVPAPAFETRGTPWTGQLEPVMASSYGSGRKSPPSGARASSSDQWEYEALPPFMRPLPRLDRIRARRPPTPGTDAVTRSDADDTQA